MAGETVYCCGCSRRLRGEDFEQRSAFRVHDQVCCSECVYDLIAELSAEEQEAILNPPAPKKTTTATRVTAARPGGTTTNVKAAPGGTQARRATASIPKAEAPAGSKTGSVTKVRQTGALPKAGPTERVQKATERIQKSTGTRALPRQTTTRSVPKADPAPPDPDAEEGAEAAAPDRRKKLLLLGGIGAGVLVIGIVTVVLLLGGKTPPPVEVAGPGPGTPVKGPAAKPPTAEEAAKEAMLEAIKIQKLNPDAVGEYFKKLQEVAVKGEGTRFADEARLELARLRRKFDDHLAKLDEDNGPLRQQELFGNLLGAWEKERERVEGTELQEPVDQRIANVKEFIKGKFTTYKDAALDFRRRGNEDAVKEQVAKVAKWELKEYSEELEKALGGVKAGDPVGAANPAAADPASAEPPKAAPLSPAMQQYMPKWQEAIGKAFVRDFEGAIADLGRLAREMDEDEVKKESSQDQEVLRQAMAFVEAAKSLVPGQIPRFQAVTLEYRHRPGEFRKVTGKVIKVTPQRIELNTEDKEKPRVFVEISDLSAGTLAELALPKSEKRDADARTAAFLCLIEGNVEAAKKHAGKAASKIAERYWSFAKEVREKAPKLSSREFEARDLFHGAELDWREVKNWGPAIEKYKTLKNDYAATRIVRDNQAVIVSRSDVGREYTFFPAPTAGGFALSASPGSTFKLMKHPKMDPAKIEQAWVTKDDADSMRDNYVEVEFHALPGVSYRCWAYIGACCQETFAFYFQTTEYIFKDKGKDKPVDPGGRFAAPNLDMPSNLKKDHADHKPRNVKEHPKEPQRWEWIQIPLPRQYAGAGPKAVRILTDQAGFGVGYVLIVPESRRTVPSDAQTKDLAKEAAGGGGEGKVTGSKEASEWLVAGPFDGALKDAHEPESGVDLGKEMKGKGGGIKWKSATATMRPVPGGQSAFFDLAKLFPQKDGSTAYLLIHVKASGPTDARLLLGHDDALKVWVNGTAVYTGNAAKKVDEATVNIKLEDGWNRLLFKVANTKDNWMLAMRVTDPDRRTIEELEYHTHGDALGK
jgi:hypothetical protein